MRLYFIDTLIDKLLIIYIICQVLFSSSLKLLFIFIYQELLYLICDNYNNYIFFVILVQIKLNVKSSFNICFYVS